MNVRISEGEPKKDKKLMYWVRGNLQQWMIGIQTYQGHLFTFRCQFSKRVSSRNINQTFNFSFFWIHETNLFWVSTRVESNPQNKRSTTNNQQWFTAKLHSILTCYWYLPSTSPPGATAATTAAVAIFWISSPMAKPLSSILDNICGGTAASSCLTGTRCMSSQGLPPQSSPCTHRMKMTRRAHHELSNYKCNLHWY